MAALYAIHERLCGRETELPPPNWHWLGDLIRITQQEVDEADENRDPMDDLE